MQVQFLQQKWTFLRAGPAGEAERTDDAGKQFALLRRVRHQSEGPQHTCANTGLWNWSHPAVPSGLVATAFDRTRINRPYLFSPVVCFFSFHHPARRQNKQTKNTVTERRADAIEWLPIAVGILLTVIILALSISTKTYLNRCLAAGCCCRRCCAASAKRNDAAASDKSEQQQHQQQQTKNVLLPDEYECGAHCLKVRLKHLGATVWRSAQTRRRINCNRDLWLLWSKAVEVCGSLWLLWWCVLNGHNVTMCN